MRKLTMLLLTLLSFTGVVKAQEKVITNLDDLSNEKAYKIEGNYGFILGNAGYVMTNYHGPMQGAKFDAGNTMHQFAILKNGDNYYLYNVGAEMFVAKSAHKAMLTPYPIHTIKIEAATNPNNDYAWTIKVNGKKINLTASSDNGVYTEWETEDDGNRWSIKEMTDFDDTDAIAVINLELAQERQDLYEECLASEAVYNSISDKTIQQAVVLKEALDNANSLHASDQATIESLNNAKATLIDAVAQVEALTYNLLFEFDLTKQKFLLKNASTNLYMTIVEKESNNQDAGGVQIKTEGTDQYFYIVTTDEENKYKIKSTDDVYLTSFSSWGYKATESENDACKHAFGYIGDGKYTIESPLGFIGSNDNATSDGSVMYSNHDINKKNIFWILEPVYAAKVGDKGYITLSEALNAAKDGETVTLLEDVTTSEIIVIDKAITLNGNTKTLTSTAGRAINVTGADGVTIKNLYINAKGERGINIIQNATNVTINSVTAKAANYAVNVASSAPNAKVIIDSSHLTGLNVVNIAAAGAQVTVNYCTLVCNDNTDSENYAALMLNKDATGASIVATNVEFNISGKSHKAWCSATNGTITIGGSQDDVKKAVAVIEYQNDYYYSFSSLEGAFSYAKTGETVKLVNNVTVDKAISVDKLVTLDFNGFKITPADNFSASAFEVTGELCFKNKVEGSIADGLIYYIINDADYKAEAGKTFNLTENKEGVSIVYKRTFSHDGWQVLYVPFDIPVSLTQDKFEVYSITGISDVVELEQVTNGTLTLNAHTPYIIKVHADKVNEELYISGAGATTLYKPADEPYTATYGDYTITGTYTSKAIAAEEEYVLTNGLWCQLTEEAVTDGKNILGAFRVYLTANGENTTSEVRFVINNSDATAIDELKAENGNVKAEVYDLSGRRVEKAEKGIFVVNGKKVVK